MSRIFLAGDFHGEIDMKDTLRNRNFPQQKELTKDDYLIQLGDFGLIWDDPISATTEQELVDWLSNKLFTTIVVLGNHENYDRITMLPVVDMFGSKVWKYTDSIFILQRGRVYTIGGKTFFTMGGAKSIDQAIRTEGRSWWRQEIPSRREFMIGLSVLDSIDWNVDYVITHTIPKRMINEYMNCQREKYFKQMGCPEGWYDRISDQFVDTDYYDDKKDIVAEYLDVVFFEHNLKFKKHFAGHFHDNWTSKDGKHNILYRSVVELIHE